ncbi:MAG TPA: arabinofuranosidase catalytic domain-containing protein [Polyangiaceae bacterium]|nr:arabinofuranosidase catalytic domain-containing protein [Polyangiaceae bacterium]
MKTQSATLALSMVFGMAVWVACDNTVDSPAGGGTANTSAGTNAAGGGSGTGSGGSAQGGACSATAACGGDAVGTWKVAASCLSVSGELNLKSFGSCEHVPTVGTRSVTGSVSLNADSTWSDKTVTTGSEQMTFGPECMMISSTPVTCEGIAGFLKTYGYATASCTAANGGCACTATVNQMGGLGLVQPAPTRDGNYKATGSELDTTGDTDAKYSYCASGGNLTLIPLSANPAVSGSVSLQKDSGGTGGSGGQAGSGGSGMGGNGGANVAGSGGANGGSGGSGTGNGTGPCDIYKAGGTPCVAAHSTVRALFGAYSGKLYQVRNASAQTKDIGTLSPGGFADGAAQATFCGNGKCELTAIYDQTGKGNDLWYQGTGSPVGGSDKPSNAAQEQLKVGGNTVYSVYIAQQNSYWVDASKNGIPLGAEPQGIYMVTSGKHYNGGCCFDYGNSELSRKYVGPGAMDSVYFGNSTQWGSGAGSGPWVMGDLEAGIFAGSKGGNNPSLPTVSATYVTAIEKNNGKTEWALRGGDATTGALSTYFKGALPGGWSPMKKEGAIVLGSGGDCCNGNTNLSIGTFYEGCIVAGYPSDATEDLLQANIVAAGYGK